MTVQRISLLVSVCLWSAVPAVAQDSKSSSPSPTFVARSAAAQSPASESARGGFTVLGSLGVGLQSDRFLNDTTVGFAPGNFGIGGFVAPNLAVLFRFSGTLAGFDVDHFDHVSGVAAGAIQYWLANRVIIEGGVGTGFWSSTEWFTSHSFTSHRSNSHFQEPERGLGVIVGASAVLFNWGKHNLLAGVEYAPVFIDPQVVHNVGFTVGYQFHNFR